MIVCIRSQFRQHRDPAFSCSPAAGVLLCIEARPYMRPGRPAIERCFRAVDMADERKRKPLAVSSQARSSASLHAIHAVNTTSCKHAARLMIWTPHPPPMAVVFVMPAVLPAMRR